MGPGAGAQTFTSPPDNDANSNTVPDANEVIHSLSTEFGGSVSAGIGQFTSDITAGFAGATNYNAALTNMCSGRCCPCQTWQSSCVIRSSGVSCCFSRIVRQNA